MILTAVFWGIWSLFAPVPAVTEILRDREAGTVLELPFAVSRWWDVLFAGLCTTGIIWCVTYPKAKEDGSAIVGFGISIAIGLGLSDVLVAGFASGIAIGLGAGLFTFVRIGLRDGPQYMIVAAHAGLGVSLGFSLGFTTGFLSSLLGGSVFGLAAGIAIGLIAGLVYGLWRLLLHPLWSFLMAREPNKKTEPQPEPNAVIKEHDRIMSKLAALDTARDALHARKTELESGAETSKVLHLHSSRHAG
jgi:hypothetical protein